MPVGDPPFGHPCYQCRLQRRWEGREFYELPLKPLEPWIWGIETQRGVNELSPGSAPTVHPSWASELSSTCHLLAAFLEGKAVCGTVGINCVCARARVCTVPLPRALCPGRSAPALNLGLASCTKTVFEPLVFVYPSVSAVGQRGAGGQKVRCVLFPAKTGLFVFPGSSLRARQGWPSCFSSDILNSETASLTLNTN